MDQIAQRTRPGALADAWRSIKQHGRHAQPNIACPNRLAHGVPEGFGGWPHPWKFGMQGSGELIGLMF